MVDRLTDFHHPVNPDGYIRANSYCIVMSTFEIDKFLE